MQQPRTEAGHLYVKLVGNLHVRRRLAHIASPTQEQEAEIATQLDRLWERMDAAEQARVERVVAARIGKA